MKEQPDYPDPLELAEALTEGSQKELPAGVEAWINASPANEASFTALAHVWKGRRDSNSPPGEAQGALISLRERLGYDQVDASGSRVVNSSNTSVSLQNSGVSEPSIKSRNGTSNSGDWKLYTSVGIAGLIAVVSFVLTPILKSDRESIVTATYVSQFGETPIIKLPDGSTVILNAASTIEVVNSKKSRTITLNGEAVFNVAPDNKRPFLVKTRDIHTTVLGTEFGVRAYDGSDITVAVKSGKVKIEACKDVDDASEPSRKVCGSQGKTRDNMLSTVLSANEMVVAESNSGLRKSMDQKIENVLAFAEGRLVLNDMPLNQAIPDLNRWYGVDIRVGDAEIGKIPLKGALPHGTIEDLEQALRVTLNANIVRSGRVITISRGNHP